MIEAAGRAGKEIIQQNDLLLPSDSSSLPTVQEATDVLPRMLKRTVGDTHQMLLPLQSAIIALQVEAFGVLCLWVNVVVRRLDLGA
jgi:hypothetical protein